MIFNSFHCLPPCFRFDIAKVCAFFRKTKLLKLKLVKSQNLFRFWQKRKY